MTNEEAILTLQEAVDDAFGAGIEIITRDGCEAIEMALEALQERKTGKWIGEYKEVTINKDGNVTGSCHCSVCGDWLTGSDEYTTRGRYCPNCGAKMEVEE